MLQDLNFYDIMIENIEKELSCIMINKEEWAIPLYSKSQIVNAGKILSNINTNAEEKNCALKVLNNWRASHAYPLQVIASNLRRNNPSAIVVQRLKRLESIIHKLELYPNMSLYRMQDLGGCRVIVNTIDDVYATIDKYKNSNIRHILKHEKDYILNPKQTGYRGYHAIYQFHSDKKETYNKNILIEIQFRTKLQHIWATAVEIMGLYTNSALKSNIGDPQILRFFAVVSSIFAIEENSPVLSNTSDDYNMLIDEIQTINKNSNILTALKAISVAIKQTKTKNKVSNGYYLLVLNFDKMVLNIRQYPKSQIEIVTSVYNKIEQQRDKNIDVVLVSASSFNALRFAYPNYFTDISNFIESIESLL